MEVNSSALPQTGISTESLPLNVNSYIDLLRVAGMPQDETQIMRVTHQGKAVNLFVKKMACINFMRRHV